MKKCVQVERQKKIEPQIGVIKVMDYFLLQYFAFFFFFSIKEKEARKNI